MSRFEVIVQLKKEVLDPEGRAIKESLGRLGLTALKDVAVSKRFLLDIAEGADQETAEGSPRDVAEKIAREYLANPVAETYEIRKL